jgi:hypothetical protein
LPFSTLYLLLREEMAPGEGTAGAGLEVMLEIVGAGLVRECKADYQLPRSMARGVA